MLVEVEIRSGNDHDEIVTVKDIQKNIDALERAIDGKTLCSDFVLLSDTKSILLGIQRFLDKKGYK